MVDEDLKEFAYDGKKDCVLRVKARSRQEADEKIRELLGVEEEIGIQYLNGVHGTCETINEMPVIFEDPDEDNECAEGDDPDEGDDEKCRTCRGPNTNGEGYDGECGNCADKRYAHDQGKHRPTADPECAACNGDD